MIENINTGICHRRLQTDEPPYFVNWIEDGKQKYFYTSVRFIAENVKERLNRIAEINKNK